MYEMFIRFRNFFTNSGYALNHSAAAIPEHLQKSQGRIQPVSFWRGDFSNIWLSSLITGSLLSESWSLLHNTDVIKLWTAKWPYIANAVFELYKIMVNKVTFVGFGGRSSQFLPPGSAPEKPYFKYQTIGALQSSFISLRSLKAGYHRMFKQTY